MERPFEEFGSLVFTEVEMEERLPSPVYLAWKKTIASESQLDRPTADAIAHAMKRWAMEHGATHFTTIASESQLDRPTADAIAHATASWAMEHSPFHTLV